MLDLLDTLLRQNPVALLFVVLAIGYLIGKQSIRGFELGPVTGVLFAGLLFGHFGYEISSTVQTFGFVMFIFSVGFDAGPGFFATVRREGGKYFLMALVVAASGFSLSVLFGSLFDFLIGTSAGLLAGAMTTTPTLAAAQAAIQSGVVALPEGVTMEDAVQNITASYAITYIFGLVGLLVFIRMLPGWLGIDLPAEALKVAGPPAHPSVAESVTIRAFRVDAEEFVGIPFGELRKQLPRGAALAKLRRGGELVDFDDDTAFELADEIAIIGRLERFVNARRIIGPELSDAELLEQEVESARIVVTKREAAGVTLGELDAPHRYGCFVNRVQRQQTHLPVEDSVELVRGDVLAVAGPPASIERLGARLGHLERTVDETDLLTLAIGIAAGIAIGAFSVKVGNVSVGLGTAGGLLTTGLLIGYLRSIYPTFGRIPNAARWVFMELGLLMFMAGVGVSAGSGVVETLLSVGPTLALCGVAVTAVPVAAGWLVGSRVLGMNPAVLLGAITGSMTSGAALSVVNEAAESSVPALGYTGAYAFANVLLTVAGTLIVRF